MGVVELTVSVCVVIATAELALQGLSEVKRSRQSNGIQGCVVFSEVASFLKSMNVIPAQCRKIITTS